MIKEFIKTKTETNEIENKNTTKKTEILNSCFLKMSI